MLPSASPRQRRFSDRIDRAAPSFGALLFCVAACSNGREPSTEVEPTCGPPCPEDPAVSSTPDPAPLGKRDTLLAKDVPLGSPEANAELAQLSRAVTAVRGSDAASLREQFPYQAWPGSSGVAREAEFMDRVQASTLALGEEDLAVLDASGFVVADPIRFPTFVDGYAAIYSEHLPVYVTADSILDAVHRSYDEILLRLEYQRLGPQLEELLTSLHGKAFSRKNEKSSYYDLYTYMDVALSLLRGSSANLAEARQLVAQAEAGEGIGSVELFGVMRAIDFSQFTPRGHYAGGLEGYFRAMTWLGRIDLRLIETLQDGSRVFRRPQFEALLALVDLMDKADFEGFSSIEHTLAALVGESDNLTLSEAQQLIMELGGVEAARAKVDAEIAAAIALGGYGEQRIVSHLMVNTGPEATLPLNRSFLLFGQRYTADSEVLSQVVYDRIPRMMPKPLDVAFAALGNSQALVVNEAELNQVAGYPGALGAMRVLIDSHGDDFWDQNLYTLWSSALRALSPPATPVDPTTVGLPSVAGTEAWGRRLLSTQLGSWAQLRHDTLLYAKQSYSTIPACEFPDAYVEPYPAFFGALVRYADRGASLLREHVSPILGLATYFENLRTTMATLQAMAQNQRDGLPHSAEQLAFINDAVRIEDEGAGCVVLEVPNGWYAGLFLDPLGAIEVDLTVADVHTQPADETGNLVGRVLHVGTGFPRLMVTVVDTCAGPRAYAGIAGSYYETTTEGFERLTDETWKRERLAATVQPSWTDSFTSR